MIKDFIINKRKNIITLLIVFCLCIVGFFGCTGGGVVDSSVDSKELKLYSTKI